jgi:hypothetical protein
MSDYFKTTPNAAADRNLLFGGDSRRGEGSYVLLPVQMVSGIQS